MSNANDFVIENGVLKKYKGSGGNVVVPEGVTRIGDSAFSWCWNLQSITLPESVTSIGDSAFRGCKGLADENGFVIMKDILFDYDGSGGNVVVPEGVTNIGNRAFENCKSLQSITLPEGLTSIGDWAFCNCWSLQSITLPEGLTSIGNSAFSGCKSLQGITLPEGLTSIGNWAFSGCKGLADENGFVIVKDILFDYDGSGGNVVVPEGVTSIGDSAFWGCKSLQSIMLPEGVTSIGSYAFYSCKNLQSITLPEGVTSIGNGAFSDCESLQSITLPESVTSIGDEAFRGCKGLADENGFVIVKDILFDYDGSGGNVVVPEGVTSIGCYAFSRCKSLQSITLPEGVTSIGDGAFRDCENLQSITLPEGVTSIESGAFRDCKNLQSITLPESVTFIGGSAFRQCRKLRRVVVLGKPESINNCFEGSDSLLLTVKLPITKIKSIQLKRRTAMGWLLREPEDPPADKEVIQSVRNYWKKSFDAFIDDIQNDTRILPALIENEMLSIDQTDRLLKLLEGNAEATAALLTYKRSRFSSDDLEKHEEKKIEKAFRAPTVAELKKIWAFKVQDDGTLKLVTYKGTNTEIVVPEKIGKKAVTAIGAKCFGFAWYYGGGFTSVPNNDVRERITSVTIPETVTKIGYSAFYQCKSLTYISLPKSVEQIASSAFVECDNLTIYAPAGTYAEQYAIEHNIPFVAE